MDTSQLSKNKGLNLSATSKEQKNTVSMDRHPNSAGQSKSRTNRCNTLHKLSACSGGVCGVNWKPLHHIA